MRTLQKLNIPTILFVNKIDRSGANTEKVMKQIKEVLSNEAFPFYSVLNEGTKKPGSLNTNHMTVVWNC